ncbi:hypothetical protein [Oceanobacillus sp. FSL K6-0127]|uniref:hypothetical protein n=1 Tax=Oceanobacillus sp. FSL K6-0127 TaxID=2921420 RepID=UPI0030EE12F9
MQYKLILEGTKPPKVLCHSGTNTVKLFDTLEDANKMKNKLNDISFDEVYWEVIPASHE